jgi:hypothetical protein
MTASGRRGALKYVGAIALLPTLALAGPVGATGRIVIPARQFILRRELERGLAGGASLIVTREWKGQFEAGPNGTRVTGEQIASTVDAPDHLEPIAAIERERRDAGPFPALLDSAGRLIGSRTQQAEGKAAAVRTAIAILERAGKSAKDLRQAKQFLSRLAESAGAFISAVPADLFFPVVGEAHDVRTLELPDGMVGEVSVWLASRSGHGGLLDLFERRITTRIGEDSRLSRETWRLRLA